MNVKKCLCADGGDNCLSPRVFESDLIGYFSFDQQLVADDAGTMKIKPDVVPGPGYGTTMLTIGLTTGSLYCNTNSTYNISSPLLKGQESLSISFWVYPIRRGKGWTNIFKKGGSPNEYTPSLSVFSQDGTLEIVVSTTKEPSTSMLSNGAIPVGRWTHVAISVALNIVKLYINGFLDIERTFDDKILFNDADVVFGANKDRVGAELFIDELKFFNTFLSRQRVIENMGGDNIPFGINTIKLSCLDCSMKDAFNGCQEGYHLSSTQEMISGGYQLAIANGWNKMNPDFWTLDPMRPNVQELRYDSALRKAGLCFKDKK